MIVSIFLCLSINSDIWLLAKSVCFQIELKQMTDDKDSECKMVCF